MHYIDHVALAIFGNDTIKIKNINDVAKREQCQVHIKMGIDHNDISKFTKKNWFKSFTLDWIVTIIGQIKRTYVGYREERKFKRRLHR